MAMKDDWKFQGVVVAAYGVLEQTGEQKHEPEQPYEFRSNKYPVNITSIEYSSGVAKIMKDFYGVDLSGEEAFEDPTLFELMLSDFVEMPVFDINVEGSFVDAFGVTQVPVSTLILLDLIFVPDQVIFRTSATGGQYGNFDTKIATDRNNVGSLDIYTFEQSVVDRKSVV